jgi:CspA family cold shock protein
MATGKVKWFSDAKGYGFILSDGEEAGRDIFVHFSEIARDGYRTLVPGQAVTFDVVDSPKGLQAKKVEPVS